MIIVERPNESIWDAYIGNFAELKLHQPEKFNAELSELKAESPEANFDKLLDTINHILNSKYRVRLPTALDYENSTNQICSQVIVDYPGLLDASRFWLNRFGLVSSNSLVNFHQRVLFKIALFFDSIVTEL